MNIRSETVSNDLICYFDLLEKLEHLIPFAYDDNFGYLTTLPTNLGILNYLIIIDITI